MNKDDVDLKFPLVQQVRTWRSSDQLQCGKSMYVRVLSFLAESQGLIVIVLITHFYMFTSMCSPPQAPQP